MIWDVRPGTEESRKSLSGVFQPFPDRWRRSSKSTCLSAVTNQSERGAHQGRVISSDSQQWRAWKRNYLVAWCDFLQWMPPLFRQDAVTSPAPDFMNFNERGVFLSSDSASCWNPREDLLTRKPKQSLCLSGHKSKDDGGTVNCSRPHFSGEVLIPSCCYKPLLLRAAREREAGIKETWAATFVPLSVWHLQRAMKLFPPSNPSHFKDRQATVYRLSLTLTQIHYGSDWIVGCGLNWFGSECCG